MCIPGSRHVLTQLIHTSDRMLAAEVAMQWSVGSALPAFGREKLTFARMETTC